MKQLIILLGLLAAPVMALDINDASYDELVAAGFSTVDAQRIVDAQLTTTFTNSRDLLAIKGITQGDLNRVRASLTINGEPVTTRSGTAPAIPGVRAAIPASKSSTVELTDKGASQGKSGNSQRGGHGGGGGSNGGGGKGKGN
ncbi:hypothetical protein PQU96_11510 [Vogesella sp. LYT5W]|uniref:Uncharacterized protein n=1 Tax=Vogesella margarita TaxID=2984199 RepID=A0ABT5IQC1_9NEIS|nr:hypothetical protein [Vogesella margarita]MDC7714742.1 hypothetical protein [Vogesella margarita]